MLPDNNIRTPTKLTVYTRLIERITLSLFVAWVIFHSTVPFLKQGLIALVGGLVIVYYITALKRVSKELGTAKELFLYKVHYIALATITLGILSGLIGSSLAIIFNLAGLAMITIPLFMGFHYVRAGSPLITRRLMFKSAVFLFISAIFLLLFRYLMVIDWPMNIGGSPNIG